MDTSGFCQVGRHGTLSLLKRHGVPVEAAGDNILTSFGIDDDELTFGSSPDCGVRLYYQDIDSLHCKIVFDQFKAFLTILGSSGVIVDGCQVFPHTSGETTGSVPQTIIPLNNDSIFEIHGKQFKFNYPPKELRKALYSTPARPPQRALRLSMIHSAQVFSPRPSNDPRENLRILQSPVKKPSSPIKNSSPLKMAILPDIEEEEIVLVHTNHPRVVEEDKDLVILEDVPLQLLSPVMITPRQTNQFPVLQTQQPPCTPRRKSLGGTALHRAVLIRSAQRAVLKAEKEREDEEEELEVLGTVVGTDDEDLAKRKIEPVEEEDVEMLDVDDENEETDDEDDDGDLEEQTQKSLWRKSLEKIIPWSLGGSVTETEVNGGREDEVEGYIAEEPVEPFSPIKPSTNLPRTFFTPQPPRYTAKDVQSTGSMVNAGRFSLGGPARRIIVEEPWKVHDLVLPPITPSQSVSHTLIAMNPPALTPDSLEGFSVVDTASSKAGTIMNGNLIPTITEGERKAIQERRKSAVKEFSSTPFWAGGAPGMSPTKGGLNSSPNKPTRAASPSKKFAYGSPTKIRLLERTITERNDSDGGHPNDDEDLDTSGLLDRIKETVNDMKRRRSVVVVGTPQSSISVLEDLSPYADNSAVVSATSEESAVRKVDFAKIGTPTKVSKHRPTPQTSPRKKSVDDEPQETTRKAESFSLLRPGAVEERRPVVSNLLREEQVVTVVPVSPATVEQTAMDNSEELQKEIVAFGGTRALRSAGNIANRDIMEDDSGDTKVTKPNSTSQAQTLDAATITSIDVSQRASRSVENGKTTTADSPPSIPEETEKLATRRVRKAQTLAKYGDQAKPSRVAPKRGRPRKNEPPTEKSQDDARPIEKPTSKVRGIVRGKTPTNKAETDSENDPLDSYETDDVPSSILIEDKASSDFASLDDVRNKSKTQAAVTKVTATRLKREEPHEDSILSVKTTRVGRRAKAMPPSQMLDVTPAVKGKTRGRPKTPATAPEITGVSISEEKENTVRSRSKPKSTEKAANSEVEEMPVKLRVSRSRVASSARNATKGFEQDDEQSLTRQRPTRMTRSRTKTG